eukprot:UN00533
MTCLTVKSDLYLKSNKVLIFQINSEDIGALRQVIYCFDLKNILSI